MSFRGRRESVILMNLSPRGKQGICSLSALRYTPVMGPKSHTSSVLTSISAFFLLLCPAFCQTPGITAPTLSITSQALPTAAPRQQYEATLQATGGVPPYRWEITSGELPQGLDLNSTTGLISGIPAERGQFEFVVTVSDSADPSHAATRNFAIGSVEALSLEWSSEPHVDQDKILGAVKVANGTKKPFDQT